MVTCESVTNTAHEPLFGEFHISFSISATYTSYFLKLCKLYSTLTVCAYYGCLSDQNSGKDYATDGIKASNPAKKDSWHGNCVCLEKKGDFTWQVLRSKKKVLPS